MSPSAICFSVAVGKGGQSVRWRFGRVKPQSLVQIGPELEARIAAAVEDGDLSLVPDLLACLWGPHSDSVEVANAVDALVRQMPVSALAEFEKGLRGWLRGHRYDLCPPPAGLTRVQPDQVRELWRFGEAGISLFGILAGHPNGFVRAAAVAALAGVETGRELPFLILRLNDWAPQVGNRALTALRARLRPGYGDAFVRCIELVERMGGWARPGESKLRAEIGRFLRSPENRSALVRAVRESVGIYHPKRNSTPPGCYGWPGNTWVSVRAMGSNV